jgi:hypothetical protein
VESDDEAQLQASRELPGVKCDFDRPSAPFVLKADDGQRVRIVPTDRWAFTWMRPEPMSVGAVVRRFREQEPADPGACGHETVVIKPGDRMAVSGVFREPGDKSEDDPYRKVDADRTVWLSAGHGRKGGLALVAGSATTAMRLWGNPNPVVRLMFQLMMWILWSIGCLSLREARLRRDRP